MVGAVVGLADAGHYLQWGWFSVSLTNLLIIVGMLVVFVLALVLPFPNGGPAEPAEPAPARTRAPADPDGPRP
jgi:hypothetical protein